MPQGWPANLIVLYGKIADKFQRCRVTRRRKVAGRPESAAVIDVDKPDVQWARCFVRTGRSCDLGKAT